MKLTHGLWGIVEIVLIALNRMENRDLSSFETLLACLGNYLTIFQQN